MFLRKSKARKKRDSFLLRLVLYLDARYASKVPIRCKSTVLRGIFTLLLVTYFSYTIYSGPLMIIASTLLIQAKCFSEIICIGYGVCKMRRSMRFRLLSWYFLIVVNYYCVCLHFREYFSAFADERQELLQMAIKHHQLIALCLYVLGIVFFVFQLGQQCDKAQFSILAWTHVTLLILVTQSYMVVKNVFQGLIWLILSVSAVSLNDMAAFAVGTKFGRTPLIQLSPKKTWEGFVGGALFTVTFGLGLSYILCQHDYMVCPIEYRRLNGSVVMLADCQRSDLFLLKNYPFELNLFGWFIIEGYVNVYPFLFHAFWLSVFASLIAPFGGFFVSGFKRAFGLKDFGNVIPGHGGIMDRFDCHYLMATFVNVYISSFVKHLSVEKLYGRVVHMSDGDQVKLFHMLGERLGQQSALGN